jgi:uncharacterized protein (TIGR00730 family)
VRSVVVFCGSRPGRNPAWRDAAWELGQGLAQAGIKLIYGGGRLGLMGVVADSVLDAGGQVRGIIPEFLTAMEVAHEGVTDLIVTDSMHSRKRQMFELADAFVTLPGGLGTMDETVEIITWRQLGLHEKPILICNVGGWADGLLGAFDRAVADGFAAPSARALFEVVADVPSILERLSALPEVALPGQSVADAQRL